MERRHTRIRYSLLPTRYRRSITPPLRLADEKITKRLHARDRFQLLRIDEEGVDRDRIGFGEQLHQAAVLLDQVVRQHRDPESALARAQDAEHVVDSEMRRARALAVAADLDQPARRPEIGGDLSAEQQHAVRVEILDRARRAEALEVFGRREGVEAHRKELALDEIRLGRLAQPDRDVRLAHGEIELLVGGDEVDAD